MLVVITDKSSCKSQRDIRAEVIPLETSGIRVIAVSVGTEVEPAKERAVSTDGDVIKTDNKKNPTDVGKKIMEKVAQGKPVFLVVNFHSVIK